MGKRNDRGPAIVYGVSCSVTGGLYVGVTSRDETLRLKEHIASALGGRGNGHFYRAIRKHGAAAFSIRVLAVCKTLGDAKKAEIAWIAKLKPRYNSTKGGDGQLGRTFSKETRRKIGAAHVGKAHHGVPHSAATKRRLSEIGRSLDNQLRWTLYQGLGPAALSRPVVCLDDGREFPSANAAARECGLSSSLVIEVCRRNPRRISAGGRVFRYRGDYTDAAAELAEAEARRQRRSEAASRRARKAVICLNDGKIYQKTAEAGTAYGIHPSFVAEVARGKKGSAHGLVFRYQEG